MVSELEKSKNSILGKVNFPEDIRRLDIASLNRLAREIREKMIDTVSSLWGRLS
jgi:deoxyxylulose-5-phosphate synthase